MLKRTIASLLINGLLLLLTTPLFAGGWAVVTVDDLPQHLRAREATTLGFTVRQHGQHPVNLDNVVVRAIDPSSGETLTFVARQTGDAGHYAVEILLPTPGLWAWEIQPDWFPVMTMAPMPVVGGETAGNETPVKATEVAVLLPWLLTGNGALVLSDALFTPRFAPQHFRPLAGMAGTIAIVGGFGRATLAALPPQVVAAQPVDVAAYGHALFMAKGCNGCHLHDQASNIRSSESGPDLTNYEKSAEYLHLWLKDPQSIKPNTAMPNLALKPAEIDALTAFLIPSKQ